MNVESRLTDLIGTAAGRLHTARSRQRPGGDRLPALGAGHHRHVGRRARRLSKSTGEKALEHAETVMPGFTHMQTAQPVTFGHHLLAYVEMAARDRGVLPMRASGSMNRRSVPARSPAPRSILGSRHDR